MPNGVANEFEELEIPDEAHSYDTYRMKRRIDKISKVTLVISVILDIGMLALSACSFEMFATIDPKNKCSTPFTKSFVLTITIVCTMRCLHIFLILLLVCSMPCFLCRDTCCLKKRLVMKKGASKSTSDALKTNWTWE